MVYYGLQKVCEQSFGNGSIDGEQGMIRYHFAQDSIYLGSGTLWVWQRPGRGFRGQGRPLTPPA